MSSKYLFTLPDGSKIDEEMLKDLLGTEKRLTKVLEQMKRAKARQRAFEEKASKEPVKKSQFLKDLKKL